MEFQLQKMLVRNKVNFLNSIECMFIVCALQQVKMAIN